MSLLHTTTNAPAREPQAGDPCDDHEQGSDPAARSQPSDENGNDPRRDPAQTSIDLAGEPTRYPSDADAAAPAAPRRIHRVPVVAQTFRIRHVRVWSVAKIAAIYCLLGYLATVLTSIVVWHVALNLGFVESGENLVRTSLGLDSFDVVGRDVLDLVLIGAGAAFALLLLAIVLLALVYNATCTLVGGVTVETAPVRRPRVGRRLLKLLPGSR